MAEIETTKPIGLALNKETAQLLLDGLNKLDQSRKQGILYEKLNKELHNIITIWDRRIKNDKLLKESRKKS